MPRRRWFQISLRTVMALLTVGCVWLGWTVERSRRQQDAVRFIREVGGDIVFDDEEEQPVVASGGIRYPRFFIRRDRTATPIVPKWFRDLLGDDFFHNVVAVRLSGPKVNCEDVQRLAHLSKLKIVLLRDTSLPDVTVRQLKKKLPACIVYADPAVQ